MTNDNSKVALVTGGSRGIGAAIALRLASDGARVAVAYVSDLSAVESIVDQVRAAGGIAAAFQSDLSDSDSPEKLTRQVVQRFGRIDILVNNAGMAEFVPLASVTADHIDRLFALNVRGLLLLSKSVVPHMAPGGTIVNIGSGAAKATPPGASVYAATKAAVAAITGSLAAELGAAGITVNTVDPGVTDTDMLRSVFNEDMRAGFASRTALGRVGIPDDIARVVAFLASDDARWVTGQVIGVNGGFK